MPNLKYHCTYRLKRGGCDTYRTTLFAEAYTEATARFAELYPEAILLEAVTANPEDDKPKEKFVMDYKQADIAVKALVAYSKRATYCQDFGGAEASDRLAKTICQQYGFNPEVYIHRK